MKRAGSKEMLETQVFAQVFNTGDINRNGQLEHTLFVSHSGENGVGIYLTVSQLQNILNWYHQNEMEDERTDPFIELPIPQ